MKLYRQVELQNGNRSYVAFIPNEKAHVGKLLTIDGEPGWRVAAAYETATEEFLDLLHKAVQQWQRVLPDRFD